MLNFLQDNLKERYFNIFNSILLFNPKLIKLIISYCFFTFSNFCITYIIVKAHNTIISHFKIINYHIRETKRWKVSCVTSWKIRQKIDNPIFKIGRSIAVLIFSGWIPFPLLVASLLFRRIFITSQMTLSSASHETVVVTVMF